MTTNLTEFYELLKLCNQLFYNEYREPNKYHYRFEKYLSDNIEITERLLDILQKEGEETFLCAPTGSGKTFEILEKVFKSTTDNTVNIICVPNRSQALQIEKEYNIPALVGKGNTNDTKSQTKIEYFIDEEKNIEMIENNYVCVYDKTTEIIQFIEKLQQVQSNLKVNFIIDEAHSLATARFREGALRQLRKLIDMILKQKGSVLYTTASSDLMVYGKFNNVIFCDCQ